MAALSRPDDGRPTPPPRFTLPEHGRVFREARNASRQFDNQPIRMNTYDSAAFESGSGLVSVDHDTPDRLAARAEPLHPDDADDWDDDLRPEEMGETVDLAGIRGIPRDALLKLVLWLVPSASHGPARAKRWRIAQLRLAVIAQALDADGFGKLSYEDLAQQLGCSRAILSWHAVRMLDGLGIDKFRQSKPRRTREIYRESAIASHKRRGHKMASDGEQPESASE